MPPCSQQILQDDSQFARKQTQPYYITALALAIPALMLGVQIAGWISFIPVIRDGHADFRNVYVAGYMVRVGRGAELYNYQAQKELQDALVSREEVALPFIRPAYQALLLVPFSLLPFRPAYCAFLLLNLTALGLAFSFLHPHMHNLARVWSGLPFGLFLFLPVGAAVMQGQDSVILLALLAAAMACLDEDHPVAAGALIAVGLFKFQLVIPIALLFLAWRQWKVFLGFFSVAVILACISIRIIGIGQLGYYIRSILSIGTSQRLGSGLPLPVDHMANLHGLAFGMFGSSKWVLFGVGIASLALMLWAGFNTPLKRELLPTAITVSAAVSYYLFIHDMSVLLIPIATTLDSCIESEAVKDKRVEHWRLRAAALLFVAPSLIAFAANQFWLASLPLVAFSLLSVKTRRPSVPVGGLR